MAYEGKQKNIPIKGIIRAGQDNMCVDGSMNEAIGMEYRDGSYVPCHAKKVSSENFYQDIDKIYIHKTSTGTNKLILSGGFLFFNEIIIGKHIAANVTDVKFIGDMACIATTTEVVYLLYKNGAYEKRNIDSEELPHVSFRVVPGVSNKESEFDDDTKLVSNIGIEYVSKIGVYDNDSDEITTIWNDINKYISTSLIAVNGEARDTGSLTGYFLVNFAYRLKNGELKYSSAPELMQYPLSEFTKDENNSIVNALNTEHPTMFHDKDTSKEDFQINENYSNLCVYDNNIYNSYSSYIQEGAFLISKKSHTDSYTKTTYNYYGRGGKTIWSNYYEEPVESAYGWIGLSNSHENVTSWSVSFGDHTLPSLLDGNTNMPYCPPFCCTVWHHMSDNSHKTIGTYSYVPTNKLQYKIDKDLLDNEEIESLCVFISPEISPYKSIEEDVIKSHIVNFSSDRTYGDYTYFIERKSNEDVIEEIKKITTLYKILEINKEDIVKSSDWITIDVSGLLGDTLLTLEQLPLTSFSNDKMYNASLKTYNYRLHAYDYIMKKYNGYPLDLFAHHTGFGMYTDVPSRVIWDGSEYPWGGTGNYKYEIDVYIDDDNGDAIVTRFESSTTEPPRVLTPILTYPSAYATKMIIRVMEEFRDSSGEEENRYHSQEYEFSLKHDFELGLSYYISNDLRPIDLSDRSCSYATDEVPVLTNTNDTVSYPNGLRVSDVAYPMYFDDKFTDRVGNGTIIGIGVLSMALSQDTFGQHPILVFCSDGVYARMVDTSGIGAYVSKAPLSREVCINKKTICEIDGAVVFASNKGLMVATSQGAKELTHHLNGPIRFSPASTDNNTVTGADIYRRMVNDVKSTELLSKISKSDFINELSTAIVSYVSNKGKLIVYGGNLDCAYFIDIASGNTTKLEHKFKFDNDNYPTEIYYTIEMSTDPLIFGYVLTGYCFDYYTVDDTTNPYSQCLLQSRPIKVTQGLKTTYRVEFTGEFINTYVDEDNEYVPYADLVVLGSLDGHNWRCIGVKEKALNEGFNNIGCVTDRVTCNYIMILFSGKLQASSHIDAIDITINNEYNNKLKV